MRYLPLLNKVKILLHFQALLFISACLCVKVTVFAEVITSSGNYTTFPKDASIFYITCQTTPTATPTGSGEIAGVASHLSRQTYISALRK